MNELAILYDYCVQKNGATETFPFGEDVLVWKVGGKMFALMRVNQVPVRLNLKCDPEKAIELRERYDAILPGYHMNKKLWNTVIVDGRLPMPLVFSMIDDSYRLIVDSLPKTERLRLSGDV